jgi:uncharacterized delta-60 repeat protein
MQNTRLGINSARTVVLLLAFALAVPVVAAAKPGQIDPSFGNHGRSLLPLASTKSTYPARQIALAGGPGGHVAIATDAKVMLLANGRPLRSFGRHGRTITPPANTRFLLGGVAVDSRGRVLVAGTAESTLGPTPGPTGSPGPPQAWAIIYRFLSNGVPDPSFGSDGVLVTDFGQRPPEAGLGGTYPYGAAAVKVGGLAVDREDRPIVAGTSVSRVTSCGYLSPYPGYETRTYVARLTDAGSTDPSFGTAGVYTNPDRENPHALALAPNGKILFANPTEAICPRIALGGDDSVSFLGATGKASRASLLGPSDDLEITVVQGLAVDRRNRIVLLLLRYQAERGGTIVAGSVRRLLPGGIADIHFGHRGNASTGLRLAQLGGLAIDAKGRILLASTGAIEGKPSNRLVLSRLGTSGILDRSYGTNGRTTAAVVKKIAGRPTLVLDSHGKAVVAAPVAPGDEVEARARTPLIALARFRG